MAGKKALAIVLLFACVGCACAMEEQSRTKEAEVGASVKADLDFGIRTCEEIATKEPGLLTILNSEPEPGHVSYRQTPGLARRFFHGLLLCLCYPCNQCAWKRCCELCADGQLSD